jgi:hypothetical protein
MLKLATLPDLLPCVVADHDGSRGRNRNAPPFPTFAIRCRELLGLSPEGRLEISLSGKHFGAGDHSWSSTNAPPDELSNIAMCESGISALPSSGKYRDV